MLLKENIIVYIQHFVLTFQKNTIYCLHFVKILLKTPKVFHIKP